MPIGLGGEQLWISPTNDGTGTSSARNDLSVPTKSNYTPGNVVPSVVSDTDNGGSYAFDFDGTTNNLTWSYDPPVQSDGVATWTAWFKISSSQGGYVLAGNLNSNKNGGGLEVRADGSVKLALLKGVGGSPSVALLTATGLAPNDQWNHVAGVFDGTNANIYINGTLASSVVIDGLGSSWQRRFRMGAYGTGNGDNSYGTTNISYSGLLDDCRAYSRALSTEEITHLASSRGAWGTPGTKAGLGDEVLWYSATFNGDGTNMGSYTATDMELKPFNSSATVETFDTNGNVSFLSPNGSNKWSTGNGYISGDPSKCSIAFWYKADIVGGTSGLGGLGTSSYNGTTLGLVKANTNEIRVYYGGNGSNLNVDSGTQYGQGLVHFAVTYDVGNSQISYYRNGVLVKQTSVSLSNLNFGTGKSFSTGIEWAGFTNAHLEDIRVYERELTADEIAWLAVAPNLEGPAPVGLGGEQMWLCPSINDSPYDISGSRNNGTYNGGMGTVADTNMGGTLAYKLDGSNDYIRIYDGGLNGGGGFADFLNSTDNWSFSVYAQTSGSLSGGGAKQTIAGGRLREKMAGVSFGINNGYSTDYDLSWKLVEPGSGANGLLSWNNNPSVDSDWHHVCFVNDGGTVSLYIDGVASAVTNTKTSDVNGVVTALNLGVGGGENPGSYYNGRMDDVRLFDRTITQAEITHLASSRGVEGPAGGGPDPPTPSGRVYNPFLSHTFHTLTGQRIR